MGRFTGSKNKLARKIGIDLNLKTAGTKSHASLLRRLTIPPGQHGQKMKRSKVSDYGKQLVEKQKVKHIYGILEKQFKRYYKKGTEYKGVTGEMLLSLLERRLDNVIYRLGFAPTRASARQLVRHGHVKVSDVTVTIPSYSVAIGEVITVRSRTAKIPMVLLSLKEKNSIPNWLVRKGTAGKIIALPKREHIPEDINEQLIVEYYSR